MTAPKVCVLTAGRGTRMGTRTEWINKALLPLQRRAILSHIIEKFPKGTPFVVALGHHGSQVRDYLELAHPEASFEFVTVDRIDGPGSGPGYSLKCCERHLQSPFYFVSCDTLWDGSPHLSTETDWVGVAQVDPAESPRYCNFEIRSGAVVRIADKSAVSGDSYRAFTGLCFIKRPQDFWRGLSGRNLVGGELQVSEGLEELRRSGQLSAVEIAWTDVGTAEAYRRALLRDEKFDFSKADEHFYLVGERALKLFSKPEIAHRRFSRANKNPQVFPEMLAQRKGFLSYRLSPGETLYRLGDVSLFRPLLQWLDQYLWKPVSVPSEELKSACRSFYREKTRERLAAYSLKYPGSLDRRLRVRGRTLRPVSELLSLVGWDSLESGVPVFFHGDLQFDNILFDLVNRRFTLIDWRQDFGGRLEFGDLYYDLAKLRGGILIDYHRVHGNEFSCSEQGDTIDFTVPEATPRERYLAELEEFIRTKGLSAERVRLLTGIIFLNMSPLHQPPFDRLVYAYGNLILDEAL